MIHTIYNPNANIAVSPPNDPPSISEQIESIPIDVIIPFIEEAWKDENYAYGEHYDNMYRTLSTRAAQLRQQLHICNDFRLYQQIEAELADVEDKLCKITYI